MSMFERIFASVVLLALIVAAGFALYSGSGVEAAEGAAGGAPAAMPVEAVIIQPEAAQIWNNFSGHIVAVDRAEIRPQVSGRIMEIRFDDGQHVEKGDILIVIDPRPYQAALDQAEASLKAAKNQADLAEKEYQRAINLIATDAIAQSVMDERTNNRAASAAAIQGAKAMVETAKINLDYAYIKAPISGKTSRAEITVGNLVQSGSGAPLLTSIVGDENVYVDFEIDEDTYLKTVKQEAIDDVSKIPVRLKLSNADLEYSGFLHSFDNRIDPASGTMRARAIFENKNRLLLPGMSVSVLMGQVDDAEKILITERSIGTDQDRKFVYVVNGESKAEYREIQVGSSIQGKRVVLSGLNIGDKVITEGIVRIRPGMEVEPKIAALKENELLVPATSEPSVIEDVPQVEESEDQMDLPAELQDQLQEPATVE